MGIIITQMSDQGSNDINSSGEGQKAPGPPG